jgi:hypothetical protein
MHDQEVIGVTFWGPRRDFRRPPPMPRMRPVRVPQERPRRRVGVQGARDTGVKAKLDQHG